MNLQKNQEDIYERYSPRLLAVCLRYVANKCEAEDVLHDAFIKIYKHLEDCEFLSERALYSWMKRISVNSCIDSLRKHRMVLLPLEESMDIPSEDNLDSDSVRKIPPEVLLDMVAKLPKGYRTIFNLYCLEGYTHSKIAQELGIKEKTSSSQYYRARQLLSQKINRYLNGKEEKK